QSKIDAALKNLTDFNQAKKASANVGTLDPLIAQAAGRPDLAGQPVSKDQLDALIKQVNAKTKLVGTTRTGQKIREDAAGNLIKIPVTSTSKPNLGASPAQAAVQGKVPALAGAAQNQNAQSPKAALSAKVPALSGGTVVGQGKTAADVGKAYDPQSNEWIQTTRNEASQRGLEQ